MNSKSTTADGKFVYRFSPKNSNSMLLVTKFKQFNAESSSGDEVKLTVSETEIVLNPH